MFGVLDHVDPPQPLPVARIQQAVRAVVTEPIVLGSQTTDATTAHLDTLDLAEFHQPVPTNEEGEDGGNGGDSAEPPVGFLDEVLEVHAVQASEESTHGEAEGADAKLEVKQHERVAIGIKNRSNTKEGISTRMTWLVRLGE